MRAFLVSFLLDRIIRVSFPYHLSPFLFEMLLPFPLTIVVVVVAQTYNIVRMHERRGIENCCPSQRPIHSIPFRSIPFGTHTPL